MAFTKILFVLGAAAFLVGGHAINKRATSDPSEYLGSLDEALADSQSPVDIKSSLFGEVRVSRDAGDVTSLDKTPKEEIIERARNKIQDMLSNATDIAMNGPGYNMCKAKAIGKMQYELFEANKEIEKCADLMPKDMRLEKSEKKNPVAECLRKAFAEFDENVGELSRTCSETTEDRKGTVS